MRRNDTVLKHIIEANCLVPDLSEKEAVERFDIVRGLLPGSF